MSKISKKIPFLFALALSILYANNAAMAMDQLGIIASLSPEDSEKVSYAVNTQQTTKKLKGIQTPQKDIYWLTRLPCNTYHVTVDLLEPTKGGNFSSADANQLETILQNFKTYAPGLKKQNYYTANGYELRMFVHFADGTHEQYNAKSVSDLLIANKDVSYANIVLKLGTNGQLRDDWRYVQGNILTKQHHSAVFTRTTPHDLETHITIANLFKYDGSKYQVNGSNIVGGKLTPAGKPYNTPFKCNGANGNELSILVDVYNTTNSNTDFSVNINLDRLQITKKQNGNLNILKEVKF